MKFVCTAFLLFFSGIIFVAAQDTAVVKRYTHKVEVTEIVQTKNYTYLRVREKINGTDSLQWLALPHFEPAVGNVFYHNGGLQMGKFHSNELNRDFDDVIFLGGLSTTEEVSDQTSLSAIPVNAADPAESAPAVMHTVKVLEALPAGGYTYLRVSEGETNYWIAVTRLSAKAGDVFHYDDAAPMKDFYSRELNRTFPEVLFIAKLSPGAAATAHDLNGPSVTGDTTATVAELVPGILSVAKVWEDKEKLQGKRVTVKGTVTRYSSDILSNNWVHLSDGTSFGAGRDLTLTTSQKVKTGDEVTFQATVSLNKDFGSGYFFELLLENAVVQP